MKPETIDPELKYCPQCADEYRADIVICADCQVPLVLGETMLEAQAVGESETSSSLVIAPNEAVVSIRRGPLLQLKELQRVVQGKGLAARLVKEEGGGCGCKGPEVLLQVREQDLQRVMAVLSDDYFQSTGLNDHDIEHVGAVFDDEHEETNCPACGTRFATSQTTCPDCGLCFG
nr:hypothetical protein [uncultured Desulfobulbus sp.]